MSINTSKHLFHRRFLQFEGLRYRFLMQLPLSSTLVNGLSYLDEVDSTNLELGRRNQASSLPNFCALVAGSQTSGQGRLGRSWVSSPNASISVSLLIRSDAPLEKLGWVNLIAGVAMQAAVASICKSSDVKVKWPNDVLVDGKKISGILSAIQPDGSIVLGVGLNLLPQPQAPEHSTSLGDLGVQADFDEALAHFLTHFRARWIVFDADPDLAIQKTIGELNEVCGTIGQSVRAELPDRTEVHGIAKEIDKQGHLVILTPEPLALAAADVWHLRN